MRGESRVGVGLGKVTVGEIARSTETRGRLMKLFDPTARVVLTAFAFFLALSLMDAVRADEIDRIREKSEELASSVRNAWYETLGDGHKPEIDRAHRDYSYLLGPKKISRMKELVEEAKSPEEGALREKSLRFLQDRTVWSKVAPTLDNFLEYERTANIQAGDTKVYLRRFWQQLAQTPDRNQRRILYLAAGELVTNANVYLLNIEIDLHNASEELGLGNYYDFLAETEGWDVEGMESLASLILVETEAEYKALLEKRAKSVLDQELRRVRAYDVPILISTTKFDDLFTVKKLERLAEKTLDGLGIKLKDQRYLRFDFKDREGKDPKAHCFPIDNDRNTRITMIADGGVDDCRSFLRCLGEAEFYYNIDNSLAYEDRFFGNPVLPMTFGELISGLLEEPAWLKERCSDISDGQMAELGETLRFFKLYDLREAAGRYLFQRKLQQDTKVSGKDYKEQMEAATLIPQTGNEEAFYLSANDRFKSGGRLVAAVLEAHLRKKMVADLGEDWFNSPGAGAYLKEIASLGFSRSPSEWVASWGASEMDPTLLLAELNSGQGD